MEQSPTISSMAKSLYVLYKKNTVSSTKKSESLFIMSAAPIQAQNINLRYAGTSQKIVTKKNAPAPVAPAPVASAPAPAPVASAPAPAPAPVAPAPVASAPAPASTSVLPPMNIVNPVNPNLKKLAEYQTVM
jgi:hypothetical protein